jgi:hypothetical protein
MTRTHRIITRRALAFAFVTSALIAAPHTSGPQAVNFDRTGPCSTCGHASPIAIDCDGTTWNIYNPGSISDAAASVCAPGTEYTWSKM